jgi:hypothetical protein
VRGDRGEVRVAVGLAWRVQRTAAGRSKAAVGQGATRGSVESRRWRWVAATASSGEGRLG